MRAMPLGAVRAICFDLDNTLWEIEPVLMRAERILADWLKLPIPAHPRTLLARRHARGARVAACASSRTRRTISPGCGARPSRGSAEAVGYERDMAHEAFALWHAARNQRRAVRRCDSGARDTQARAIGWRRSPTAMPISRRSDSRTILKSL